MNPKIFELTKLTTGGVKEKDLTSNSWKDWIITTSTSGSLTSIADSNGLTAQWYNPQQTLRVLSNGQVIDTFNYNQTYIMARCKVSNLISANTLQIDFTVTYTNSGNWLGNTSITRSLWSQQWEYYIGYNSRSSSGIILNYDGLSVRYNDNTTSKLLTQDWKGNQGGADKPPGTTYNISLYVNFRECVIYLKVNNAEYNLVWNKSKKLQLTNYIAFYNTLEAWTNARMATNLVYYGYTATNIIKIPTLLKITY